MAATMRAQIEKAIASLEGEIERIQASSKADIANCRERMKLLRRAADKCDDELEAVIVGLRTAGLWPPKE